MNSIKNVIGVDIAKQVFQVHWVDAESGEVKSKQIKRDKFPKRIGTSISFIKNWDIHIFLWTDEGWTKNWKRIGTSISFVSTSPTPSRRLQPNLQQ